MNRDGKPVAGLTSAGIELKIDGKGRTIINLQRVTGTQPLNTISGSTREAG